jgi:SynChlorMet cassette protein ScmC
MTGSNQIYSKVYCLSLSDGNKWQITGYEDGIRFADKLAFVMNLKECSLDNSPMLVFVENTNDIINEDHINLFKKIIPTFEPDWRIYNFCKHQIWFDSEISNVICQSLYEEYLYNAEYFIIWNSLNLIYQRSMKTGGIPFHAGVAEYKGHGILLSAQSGTGKSTCCRRLPSHWKVLCDDEALVVRDVNGKYRIHPFPTWSNYFENRELKTWSVEDSTSASAIFFLEQSDIDEVIPLDTSQSAMLITGSVTQACNMFISDMGKEYQPKFIREVFNNAFEIAKTIPAFRLRVSLNGRFWEEIEKVLPL